jgi:hypothetical protein
VGERPKACGPGDPADDHCGDYRNDVAYDPAHRLVPAVIPGARAEENGGAIVAEFEELTPEHRPLKIDFASRYSSWVCGAMLTEPSPTGPIAPSGPPTPHPRVPTMG